MKVHTAPTPKALLHEFYMKQGLKETLKFEVHSGAPPPAPPHFLCNLVIPALDCKEANYPVQEFSGEGQSKRASEQVASQKALAFLQSKNLIPQEPLTTPDWPTPTTPLPPPPAAQQGALIVQPVVEGPSEAEPSLAERKAWVLLQLGGKSVEELGPLELKNALEKALQNNTDLKASLHHDQLRRHRAMAILLGIN